MSGGLRAAFNSDGILAEDDFEHVVQQYDLPAFHAYEAERVAEARRPGPVASVACGIEKIQRLELVHASQCTDCGQRLFSALAAERSARSREGVIQSLKAWDVRIDDALLPAISIGRGLSAC
ncbi:5'-nucleotidase [Kocuria rosea]|uniref:5'-nucleotidase n=1 Tax=Kocuria rosea TaxID=1275 RepID=UPI0035B0059B